MSELIPGTALPYHVGPGGQQREGRGDVKLTPEREPVAFVGKPEALGLSPAELAFLRAAINAFDRKPRKLRTVEAQTAKQTDATTGNLVLPLWQGPEGTEGHVTHVTVDAAGSSTIHPAAPYSNAASFAYLAVGQASSGPGNSTADTYRQALVAFAPLPASATGPLIPFEWSYNDKQSPVVQGGEMLYYVLHGGSQAAIQNLLIQVTYRVELYGYEGHE